MIRKQAELDQYLKIYGNDDVETVEIQEAVDSNQEEIVLEGCEELSNDTIYLEEDEHYVEETMSQIISDNEPENFEEVEEIGDVDDDLEDFSHLNFEMRGAESDVEVNCHSLTSKLNPSVPRLEDVKYDKVTPTLVLTPNFLKAREALKTLPKDSKELSDYFSVTVESDSVERVVFVCSNSKCKFEFSSEEEMKLHLVDHKFVTDKKCEYCPMRFKTRHFYEKHLDSVHNDPQFICQVCGKVFNTQRQYTSHLRNHDHTKKFQCNIEGCDKAFRVKHHLDNHRRVHQRESPFACTFEGCSARFRQKHALTIHKRKHTGEFIVCDDCKSPFVTQFSLNKHLEKCNGTYKPFVTRVPNGKRSLDSSERLKCPIDDCAGSYKAKISLEKHLTNVHQIVVTNTMCVICCQEFDSQQSLKQHLRDHLPFSCGLCSVNFKTEENLQSHMSRSHEKDEVRLHRCQQCSAAFKRAEHLKSHINYKHSTADRPYSCDFCSYKSQTRQDLNSHMKTHIKSKDFTCRLCNFAGSKLGTVKNHLKSAHNTEDYYYCYTCSQGFKYNQEFIQHQKECC